MHLLGSGNLYFHLKKLENKQQIKSNVSVKKLKVRRNQGHKNRKSVDKKSVTSKLSSLKRSINDKSLARLAMGERERKKTNY